MTTQTAQTAQNYPQSNSSGFKTLLAIMAGIFLFLAIQHHVFTAIFCGLLSLIFESFSLKIESKSLIPEIFCISLFTLSWFGAWHLIKFYFVQILIVLTIVIIASVMFSDNFQLPESGSLAVIGRDE